jgi:hypothetical protein
MTTYNHYAIVPMEFISMASRLGGHDIYILNNDEDKCWRAPIVNYFQDSDDSWMGTEQELLWKSYVNMSDI